MANILLALCYVMSVEKDFPLHKPVVTMKPPKTILYAEDDEVTLYAYASRLEQAGYIVQTAVDGLEAIKCLHHFPPDLMLLDLMLPKFKDAISDISPLSALMQVKQKHETEVDISITDE